MVEISGGARKNIVIKSIMLARTRTRRYFFYFFLRVVVCVREEKGGRNIDSGLGGTLGSLSIG